MRCVGYRQAWEALDANDLASLPERGIAATRQLAKRQLTWLRGMAPREVMACDEAGVTEHLVERAKRHADTVMKEA
jgi:tRNA dimethylallyltransferase